MSKRGLPPSVLAELAKFSRFRLGNNPAVTVFTLCTAIGVGRAKSNALSVFLHPLVNNEVIHCTDPLVGLQSTCDCQRPLARFDLGYNRFINYILVFD